MSPLESRLRADGWCEQGIDWLQSLPYVYEVKCRIADKMKAALDAWHEGSPQMETTPEHVRLSIEVLIADPQKLRDDAKRFHVDDAENRPLYELARWVIVSDGFVSDEVQITDVEPLPANTVVWWQAQAGGDEPNVVCPSKSCYSNFGRPELAATDGAVIGGPCPSEITTTRGETYTCGTTLIAARRAMVAVES